MVAIPRTGITAETPKRIIEDEGVLFANFGEVDQFLFGSTSGGNTVTHEISVRMSEPAGARGPVKGLRSVEEAVYRLTVNLFEHTLENFKRFMRAEEENSEVTGYTKIRPRLDILETDYMKNIALAVRLKNTDRYVVHVLENAMPDEEIEMSHEDKNDLTTEVQFTAHYDPADVSKVPYYVLYPEDESPSGGE
jgi:hypothetical protein